MTILEKANEILAEKTEYIIPANLKSGVTAFGVTGTLVELKGEERLVDPSTSAQIITPTTGKNGITEITVSAVTSSIDQNIVPANIKKNVTILGVTGTMEGGIDTSDATATADDMELGKTAYVNGVKITGTVPYTDSGDVDCDIEYIVDDPTEQEIRMECTPISSDRQIIDNSALMKVAPSYSTIASTIGLTANKIKKDAVVLGVTGTYEGTSTAVGLHEIHNGTYIYFDGPALANILNSLPAAAKSKTVVKDLATDNTPAITLTCAYSKYNTTNSYAIGLGFYQAQDGIAIMAYTPTNAYQVFAIDIESSSGVNPDYKSVMTINDVITLLTNLGPRQGLISTDLPLDTALYIYDCISIKINLAEQYQSNTTINITNISTPIISFEHVNGEFENGDTMLLNGSFIKDKILDAAEQSDLTKLVYGVATGFTPCLKIADVIYDDGTTQTPAILGLTREDIDGHEYISLSVGGQNVTKRILCHLRTHEGCNPWGNDTNVQELASIIGWVIQDETRTITLPAGHSIIIPQPITSINVLGPTVDITVTTSYSMPLFTFTNAVVNANE